MKLLRYLTLLLSLLVFTNQGFGQISNSAFFLGGTYNDYGYSISVDNLGNRIVAGDFTGGADFDPTSSIKNLTTSIFDSDIFIAKYNSIGEYIWAIQIGGTYYEEIKSVTTDLDGNIYATGYFYQLADFDPSTNIITLASNGIDDIFIAKYSSSGQYKWTINIGGSSGDYGNSIVTDQNGNVYVTGVFQGVVDFDPSFNVANLTTFNGGGNVFVAKYDSSGNYKWALNLSGQCNGEGNSLAIDLNGNIYVTGYFNGTADFDPSSGVMNLSAENLAGDSGDVFVVKYDSNGSFKWAFKIGSSNYEYGYKIKTDDSANVYVIGEFMASIDFNPLPESSFLTSKGNFDIFVSKYDNYGLYQWALNIGGKNSDYGNGIAIDSDENVFVTGFFSGSIDFDQNNTLMSNGLKDIFISKYNSSGKYVWAFNIGSSGNDQGNDISLDNNNYLNAVGNFSGTVDFDPSESALNLFSNSLLNIFVAKYGSSLLPVEMVNFDCSVSGSNILLKWQTQSEQNNAGFEIQKKSKGQPESQWQPIGFIEGKGTTTESQTYSFSSSVPSPLSPTVYRLKQIDLDGTFTYSKTLEFKPEAPLTFSLSQNYPNPFNPSTSISFVLPVTSSIELNVYNVLGEKVSTVINKTLPAGTHQVQFDASGFTSGIYFYQLKAGNYRQTKKMIVMK